MTALVLFRRDLRVADNAALVAASQSHHRVIPLYIHEPAAPAWSTGAASRWWLHHSLAGLESGMARCGAELNLYRGDTLPILLDLCRRESVRAVYWNRRYEPAEIAPDRHLAAALRTQGVSVQTYPGALFLEPAALATQGGEPYKVFTPFWRKLHAQLQVTQPLPEPRLKPSGQKRLRGSTSLESLRLLPRLGWDSGMRQNWHPGEEGAHVALQEFVREAVGAYATDRDLPGRRGTSRLSPHLHFGEITPRQVHHALERTARSHDGSPIAYEPFLRQLGWREFAHHLLFHFPDTPKRNFNPRFDAFRWARRDAAALERWQKGRTGYPLVDAGMRELWHTGWMHNRVRMVVASFLTKNLLQHWSHGAEWFWDTLVDADLANNTLGWQWVAGSGADAAPYFRVFNPVTQARKFDPEGTYLRRWLPELAGVPLATLHEPWKDPDALRRTGYSEPMVDLAASRQRALSAYQALPA